MANETELSNFIIKANEISAAIAPAFVDASVCMNLVHAETCSPDSNVIKFRKSGSLTAATLAESTAYTYSASSELTDTSITATAVKAAVVSKLTVEAQRFGTSLASLDRLAAEQGRALARLFDDTVIALFTGFSQLVTATSTLTVDNLLDAQYTIFSGGTPPGRLCFVGHYKGVNELGKVALNTNASAFTNPNFLDLIGQPKANNFKGSIADIDVYQTSGHATTGGDNRQAMFHPDLAFCCALGGAFQTAISPLLISTGFWTEVGSYFFFDVKEWNDLAGVEVRSDS